MLFDTDVLIWFLRGNAKAAEAIDAALDRRVSIVSYMELLQGARNKTELRLIQAFLRDMVIQMAPLSENIGHRAAVYMVEYGLRVALCMGDALIAATAVEARTPLCTGNRKHFRLIEDLEIATFRP